MIFQEGKAVIKAAKGTISKKLDVFYNPVMKFNRDLSLRLLDAWSKNNLQVMDLLAGSGIRSLRFLKELPKRKIKTLFVNDKQLDFFSLMHQQVKLNKIVLSEVQFYKTEKDFHYAMQKSKHSINKKLQTKKRINITNEEANQLLLKTSGFDYIDIDPFGTPNPFLDAAVKSISREGILGVTVTDTSALTGTYENPTKRKYWAKPLKNELMHETGLRIFIRKVQLIGAQYEKALVPLLSFWKEHYYRVFFQCRKGKQHVDAVLKQHQYWLHCKECLTHTASRWNLGECCKKQSLWAGPLFTGKLQDDALLKKMIAKTKIHAPFLRRLWEENKIQGIGFYDLHKLGKKRKMKSMPDMQAVMAAIRKKKKRVARSSFSLTGIKTDMPSKQVINLVETLQD